MPIGLYPSAGDLPCRQAVHDAWIVPGRVRPLRDLGPCDWQQWAGDGGHRRRPAGWEEDAKLQAIIHAVREGGISCRSKTPTLVEHNSRSEGKLGPKWTAAPFSTCGAVAQNRTLALAAAEPAGDDNKCGPQECA